MNEHPIKPTTELVQQWFTEGHYQDYCSSTTYAIHQAARWGADQELEACCQWLDEVGPAAIQLWGDDLRQDRRPKPPSLKQQALKTVSEMAACMKEGFVPKRSDLDSIRRAIEALPDE